MHFVKGRKHSLWE